ncbi:LCP family protein [Planosporangium flavigriseum]|uniref:LytTR family transcriptional regulator n=1 Tax=Planosporangium flavigriseum TaxID=373681 RepID=A0A8J3LY69_9ACTN|nr:LCP family protein [Planosporangium flavigriseum]GIG75535.1 LytTR family transcriptional regulator [Planosporangium flavigriseum]
MPAVGRGGSGRPAKRRTSRRSQILLGICGGLAILLGVTLIGAYTLMNRVTGNVNRIDNAFAGLDEKQRPTKPAATKNSTNFLLLGSDSRDGQQTTGSNAKSKAWEAGAQRTDTIMLVHIPADRGSAQVLSIPRDSWVEIPGKGKNKINAAYALGGPSLLIKTVENLTRVRIDHFAIIDFAGFTSIIDAIGGVDVEIAQDTVDLVGNRFRKGVNHLDGTKALFYVRQRHGLENGDFDRVKRQQNLIRAVMNKLNTFNPATDPVGAFRLMDAVTKSFSVDSGLSDAEMRSLAFDVPGIRNGGITFLTVPTTGTGWEGDQSVVRLNVAQGTELWNAVNNDTVPAYANAHSNDLLPAVPK